jgi:hypothetical protein
VIEARKFSGLAVDTLVELTKDNYAPSTRYVAATALLDRRDNETAQRMTDAELAALEARMITIPASVALEHVDEPQVDGNTDAAQDGDGCGDDAGELPDGDAEDSPPDATP